MPKPQLSAFRTVSDVLADVEGTTDQPYSDNPWYVKAEKILGKNASVLCILYCAWELSYGEPAVIARRRTLRAMYMG